MDAIRKVELGPEAESTKVVAEVQRALGGAHAVHVVGLRPGDPRHYWDEVTARIGRCHDLAELPDGTKTGEKWMEIRFDPAVPNAYRHSKNAQPMHTDGSYITGAPALIFFYCVAQAREGGATTFIPGRDLVATLAQHAPALLQRLRTTSVRFAKAGDAKARPIIAGTGDDLRLTWNYHCVDDPPNQALAEEFHAFLNEHVVGTPRALGVRMSAGDGLFWWDERSLHGRESFAAETANERFLWKTGIHV